jgi:hypothetical protein
MQRRCWAINKPIFFGTKKGWSLDQLFFVRVKLNALSPMSSSKIICASLSTLAITMTGVCTFLWQLSRHVSQYREFRSTNNLAEIAVSWGVFKKEQSGPAGSLNFIRRCAVPVKIILARLAFVPCRKVFSRCCRQYEYVSVV